jgi:hypothetical protein
MNYQVVYDISETSPAWWFPGVGVGFTIASCAMWHFRHRMLWAWHWPLRDSALGRTIFCAAFLGYSASWTTVAGAGVVGGHYRAQHLLRAGLASVVEGTVEDFHPMPYNGHDTERFTVDGVHFAYSDFAVGEGFNHTSSHGGPMRAGLHVRVHYQGPMILRLEVERP